ncbi:MAG: hypothetical protein ACMUIG_00115 [Thermoplasmatota archaeon]
MDEGKDEIRGDGFAPVGPFKGRPTFIRSALRPVDPRISIRIDEMIRNLRSGGVKDDPGISIGIRSLDGYYTNGSNITLLQIKGEELLDIINFDPTREVFMISGEGQADISAELLWFGFEAFPDDSTMCIAGESGTWPMVIPEKSDDRIDLALDILRKWKQNKCAVINGYRFFRGSAIQDLEHYLLSEFAESDQKSQ